VRILHVQKAAGIGGSERHLLSLLPALAETGVEVRICVAAAGRAEDFTKRLREVGVPHAVVRAGPDLNPLLVGALVREIRAFRPDLVHTHLMHADLHGQLAAQLSGVKGVSSVHGTHGFYGREPYRGVGRLVGRATRLTIAISEHVKRFIEDQRLSRPGAIRVIPYGLDARGWLASEADRASARAALGLDDGDVAIGVASRLVPDKGHPLLLEAYAQASQEAPQLRLLIAGDGPLRADLEQQAEALGGRVFFLGFVPEIREFMNACDVLAFPTQPGFGEGFGLAALEAMAAARPVVASNLDSLPEVVGTGETGMLVDPGSVDDLAAALVRLGGDETLRGRMGNLGRERVLSRFSLGAMVERTTAAYEEAITGRLRGP
jgi:glycosyltransferase involved in cell wall biosynthesis